MNKLQKTPYNLNNLAKNITIELSYTIYLKMKKLYNLQSLGRFNPVNTFMHNFKIMISNKITYYSK